MEADVIDGPVEELSAYLNLLPGYDGSENQITLLDITRQVWDSENYYAMLVPFPTGQDIFFNQPGSGNVFETFSGNVTIPPFSLLTSISAFSLNQEHAPPQLGANFKLRIYDKGGRVDMISKQFTYNLEASSPMKGELSGIVQPPQDDPFGPYFLLERKFVMPPGLLNIEITDLTGQVNNIIQILLAFACPLTTAATNTQQITEG